MYEKQTRYCDFKDRLENIRNDNKNSLQSMQGLILETEDMNIIQILTWTFCEIDDLYAIRSNFSPHGL